MNRTKLPVFTPVVPILLMITLFAACSEPTERVYTGSAIQIDYGSAEEILDGQWIEVDGIRFTHTSDVEISTHEDFYITATQVEYLEVMSPVDTHTIALQFTSRLQEAMRNINRESEEGPVHHVQVVQDLHLFGASRVTLRSDEGEFTVRTSAVYGAPVQVVE